jgi:hypothetical protein
MQILKTLKRDTMNKLLNPISWSAYLETVAVLAIAFYAYIGWKYYSPEIGRLLARISGKADDGKELPDALRYQDEEQEEAVAAVPFTAGDEQMAVSDESTAEYEEVAQELHKMIESATGKPYAPAALIPRLKKILNDYPRVADTADRKKINALIVLELERTGTALLSEEVVDQWWES